WALAGRFRVRSPHHRPDREADRAFRRTRRRAHVMVELASFPTLRSRMSAGWRRLSKLPFRAQILIFGATAALAPVSPAVGVRTEAWAWRGVSVLTSAMLGMGLNIVVGSAGLLDLGYAAFFAIAAYTTAVMTVKLGYNFWLSIIPAIAIAGTAGAILGYPTL